MRSNWQMHRHNESKQRHLSCCIRVGSLALGHQSESNRPENSPGHKTPEVVRGV